MKALSIIRATLLLILISASLPAAENQLTLSTYLDSNPIESLADPEATWGLKLQERLSFMGSSGTWSYDGSVVGQGFLEPVLLLDSKLVANAILNLRRDLGPRLSFQTNLISFQKLYLSELEHSSRSSLNLWLEHAGAADRLQRVGLELIHSRVNSGLIYTYADQRASFLLRHALYPGLLAEWSLMVGLATFRDLPARSFIDGVVQNLSEDQQDHYSLVGLHLRHAGQMIWGLSLSHQRVRSNSDLAESTLWLARLYLSRRFGPRVFMHAVIQGMDKNYSQDLYTATTPTRDPEETIQNQIHLQLERVIDPRKVIYVQYSYARNETIYNYWFYQKHLFEAGLKLSF